MRVITTEEVRNIFNCTERVAYRKLRQVRLALGKKTGEKSKKGADPVTYEEFVKHFKLS